MWVREGVGETKIQVQKQPSGLLLSMNLQSGSLSSPFPPIQALLSHCSHRHLLPEEVSSTERAKQISRKTGDWEIRVNIKKGSWVQLHGFAWKCSPWSACKVQFQHNSLPPTCPSQKSAHFGGIFCAPFLQFGQNRFRRLKQIPAFSCAPKP